MLLAEELGPGHACRNRRSHLLPGSVDDLKELDSEPLGAAASQAWIDGGHLRDEGDRARRLQRVTDVPGVPTGDAHYLGNVYRRLSSGQPQPQVMVLVGREVLRVAPDFHDRRSADDDGAGRDEVASEK